MPSMKSETSSLKLRIASSPSLADPRAGPCCGLIFHQTASHVMWGGARVPPHMNNLYEDIQANPTFNRLEVGDLLFAEYTCPLETDLFEVWSDHDYLVHVVSGRKTWHTSDGSWTVTDGETLFFKKGAAVVEQHFETDFCVLIFFIPDPLPREVIADHLSELDPAPPGGGTPQSAIPVQDDVGLNAFFSSMKSYFSGDEKPTEPLLRLKLKELILSVLLSKTNPDLACYFRDLAASEGPSLSATMEANYRYRLSLDEFAKLCHRSLSSFKRDFRKHYDEAPGRWLLQKRLDFAAALLRSGPKKTITDVVFDSGFEDVSHFSRAFRDRYQMSPTEYRESSKGAN